MRPHCSGRRVLVVLASMLVVAGVWAQPARAASDPVTSAAQALRTSRLYVDPGAAGVLSASDLSGTRAALRASTAPVLVAVVPATAASEVGGADNLPTAIGRDTGRAGIYLVVSAAGIRASSDVLAPGEAGSIATTALQDYEHAGRGAVVEAFIRSATSAYRSRSTGSAAPGSAATGSQAGGSQAGGSQAGGSQPVAKTAGGAKSAFGYVALLVVLALVAAGLGVRASRRRRSRAARDAADFQSRQADVRADVEALAQDLMVYDSGSNPSPTTPADRSMATAWARYHAADSDLGSARNSHDLQRVAAITRQGRLAFEDGVAQREGRPTARQVYESVSAKAREGRAPDPDQRRPVAPDGQTRGSTTVIHNYSTVNYPGYGYGWYPGFGYGYYNYGGGFVSGMLLGELLANDRAWGPGYGGDFDGGYGNGGYGNGGYGNGGYGDGGYGQDQGGGGDWSGDTGNGGDWGGGGFDTGGGGDWGGGGGDWGGGDTGGGGDWGGGDPGGGGNW